MDDPFTIFSAFGEQFAPWEKKAKFTVDFCHVGEHLSEAGQSIAPTNKKPWLHQQRGLLLENKIPAVLQTLAAHFEPEEKEPAPVRGAHQYIDKRKQNIDYAGARYPGASHWLRRNRERTSARDSAAPENRRGLVDHSKC